MAFRSRGRNGGGQQRKDNTGALFENDRKESRDHPDFTGSIVVAGREYWVAGWENESRDGRPYLGLKLRPKNEERGRSYQRPLRRDEGRSFGRSRRDDDDLPPRREPSNSYARARGGEDAPPDSWRDRESPGGGMLDDEIPF